MWLQSDIHQEAFSNLPLHYLAPWLKIDLSVLAWLQMIQEQLL